MRALWANVSNSLDICKRGLFNGKHKNNLRMPPLISRASCVGAGLGQPKDVPGNGEPGEQPTPRFYTDLLP